MSNRRTIAVRRSLAFGLDWLVVVLWGGVVFGAVTIATHGTCLRRRVLGRRKPSAC